VFTLSTDLAVSSAPAERASAAAALSETGSELGGALGIAVLGSVGGVVYRSALAGHLPSTLAPDTAAAVSSTLGAALHVAAGLSEPERVRLVEASRAAFTHALEVTSGIAAAMALLLAIGSALVLRERRPALLPAALGQNPA
jgi:DHA2 family multidrug resistance protein-like MFS transporter